jgi:predicted transcriptional regulator
MSTFTSTLPDDLLARLSDAAKELALPKNKLIENALRIYLEQLKKAEYVKSYSRMDKDADILLMVEEGMAEYYIQLQEE